MKEKHIHKFMKVNIGGNKIVKTSNGRVLQRNKYEVFKCQEPGCTTHFPRELVINNISKCWACELPLLLDMENTKLKKPTHVQCRKIRMKENAA